MLHATAGAALKDARERANLSQLDLHKKTGVSIWTISDIETGRNRTPRRRTVLALAAALDLDASKLLEEVVA